MKVFDLPKRTEVNRVIPKNAFDAYTNANQKKQFTDLVQRITWTNKLSRETTNLKKGEFEEIQVFSIELKQKSRIDKVLEIMNRAMPYHIISVVEYDEEVYLSTSQKHAHPQNENTSVIDWTFETDWLPMEGDLPKPQLKESLEFVFKDFCDQLTETSDKKEDISLEELVQREAKRDKLQKEIKKLELAIKRCKQFNKKVELNQELRIKKEELNSTK